MELSGSEWAWVTHQHLGGVPPQVDLAREKQLAGLLADAARVGHLGSAHDLSDGGLAQSLVESCLRHGVGARIAVPERFEGTLDAVRVPVQRVRRPGAGPVPRGHEKAFTALCGEHGVPWELIGVTDPTGGALEVHGQFRIGLDELREAHTGTLPALFGGVQPFEVTAPAEVEDVVDVPTTDLDADSPTDSAVEPTGFAVESAGLAPADERPDDEQAADGEQAVDGEQAESAPETTEQTPDRSAGRAVPPVRTERVESGRDRGPGAAGQLRRGGGSAAG